MMVCGWARLLDICTPHRDTIAVFLKVVCRPTLRKLLPVRSGLFTYRLCSHGPLAVVHHLQTRGVVGSSGLGHTVSGSSSWLLWGLFPTLALRVQKMRACKRSKKPCLYRQKLQIPPRIIIHRFWRITATIKWFLFLKNQGRTLEPTPKGTLSSFALKELEKEKRGKQAEVSSSWPLSLRHADTFR